MSGIGEAFLDGIPMLVISGGIRRDSGRSYQLHDIDQEKLTKALTKGYFLAENHTSIVPLIFQAYELAITGEPGPVFVEIPSNLLLFTESLSDLPNYTKKIKNPQIDQSVIESIVNLLIAAKNPAMYVGYGARDCQQELEEISTLLSMPVSTTMQGVSVFSSDHPYHTGMGFGPSGVPAAQFAFENCDCLLAIGVRFGELATGSYGLNVPKNLIHVDINSKVFNQNYPASITLQADAGEAVRLILKNIKTRKIDQRKESGMVEAIKDLKKKYESEWESSSNINIVNPYLFFKQLKRFLGDGYLVLDDGNHTFLAAELYKSILSKHVISPTDFNAMGYCVPAAIGVKFSNRESHVVGVVGDGGFLMTGLELLTATTNQLGIIIFVFHDGELGQISQFQQIPLNRKTCTILGEIKIEGIAQATGAAFFEIQNDLEIEKVMKEAFKISTTGRPVLVDVKVDYSKKTAFTKGVVSVNFGRFTLGQKFRFIGRAAKRHLFG